MNQRMLIGIEPTDRCNLNCLHCLRPPKSTYKELSLDFFDSLLQSLKAYGNPHIAFTGGEPTLHSQFLDMLQLLKTHGYSCNIVTNGQNFAELLPDFLAYKSRILSIAFSLDGASEQTHDQIRGAGSFHRVLLAIALASLKGFHVTVQIVANRLNKNEIAELPELCKRLGVQWLFVSHAQPTPKLYAKSLQLDPGEWKALETEMHLLAKTTQGVKPRLSVGVYDPGSIAPCQTLQHQALNINARGELTLCCQLSGVGAKDCQKDIVADLHNTSLADAHAKLLNMIHEILHERLQTFSRDSVCELDHFQCWQCLKRFQKIDWIKKYPSDPWVQGDPCWEG